MGRLRTKPKQRKTHIMSTETENSAEQAKAQLESIREMVAELRKADEAADTDARETAEQAIHEDPLEVVVRSGWYSAGSELPTKPEEYRILLCTGGPACQIIGTLSEYGEPETARIEHQDWGTPWTDYPISADDEEIVLEYCRQFYFEG